MTCRDCEKMRDEYRAGLLAAEARARFEEHLRSCSACREGLAEDERLADLLRSAAARVPGDQYFDRVRREALARAKVREKGRIIPPLRLSRWMAVAAVLAVFAVIGSVVFQSMLEPTRHEAQKQIARATVVNADHEQAVAVTPATVDRARQAIERYSGEAKDASGNASIEVAAGRPSGRAAGIPVAAPPPAATPGAAAPPAAGAPAAVAQSGPVSFGGMVMVSPAATTRGDDSRVRPSAGAFAYDEAAPAKKSAEKIQEIEDQLALQDGSHRAFSNVSPTPGMALGVEFKQKVDLAAAATPRPPDADADLLLKVAELPAAPEKARRRIVARARPQNESDEERGIYSNVFFGSEATTSVGYQPSLSTTTQKYESQEGKHEPQERIAKAAAFSRGESVKTQEGVWDSPARQIAQLSDADVIVDDKMESATLLYSFGTGVTNAPAPPSYSQAEDARLRCDWPRAVELYLVAADDGATSASLRADALLKAAEILEVRIGDSARAAETYRRVLAPPYREQLSEEAIRAAEAKLQDPR